MLKLLPWNFLQVPSDGILAFEICPERCALPGESYLSEAILILICSVNSLEICWSFFCHLLCQCDNQIPQAVIERASESSYPLAWPSVILGSEGRSPSQSRLPFFLPPPSSPRKQPDSLVPARCLGQMTYHLSPLPLVETVRATSQGS